MNVNFYHDEPLFGLDIGHSYLKAMQLETKRGKAPQVLGYGVSPYSPQSMTNGVIIDFAAMGRSLYALFNEHITGSIATKRVACTIPASKTFSHPMKVPNMDHDDLSEAVRSEAEQYIPLHPDNLYIDYEILRQNEETIELLMVATPKNIVDSYVKLLQSVGLEPVALEPTMNATARVFKAADPAHDQPSIMVDFGSSSIDVAVFDKNIFVNSTLTGGGDVLTDLIAKQLKISPQEAYDIKHSEGIGQGPKMLAILNASKPVLDSLVREILRVMRYYNDRNSANRGKISQIITLGGGSGMPGFNKYLSDQLNLPTRMLNPWERIRFGQLTPPSESGRSIYTTVAGEAILNPKEILA